MNFNEYQANAKSTQASSLGAMCILSKDEPMADLVHAHLGLTSELGELADAMKKYFFYGRELDRVNVLEELGDVMWYIAVAATAMGADLETVANANIAKLQARFPDKFGDLGAISRNTEIEREILENEFRTNPNQTGLGL